MFFKINRFSFLLLTCFMGSEVISVNTNEQWKDEDRLFYNLNISDIKLDSVNYYSEVSLACEDNINTECSNYTATLHKIYPVYGTEKCTIFFNDATEFEAKTHSIKSFGSNGMIVVITTLMKFKKWNGNPCKLNIFVYSDVFGKNQNCTFLEAYDADSTMCSSNIKPSILTYYKLFEVFYKHDKEIGTHRIEFSDTIDNNSSERNQRFLTTYDIQKGDEVHSFSKFDYVVFSRTKMNLNFFIFNGKLVCQMSINDLKIPNPDDVHVVTSGSNIVVLLTSSA